MILILLKRGYYSLFFVELGEKGLGGSIIVDMKTSLYNQIILKISEIEKIINEGKGYNPYRDAKGRFANGPSSAFGDYYVGGSMGSYDRLDRAGLKRYCF